MIVSPISTVSPTCGLTRYSNPPLRFIVKKFRLPSRSVNEGTEPGGNICTPLTASLQLAKPGRALAKNDNRESRILAFTPERSCVRLPPENSPWPLLSRGKTLNAELRENVRFRLKVNSGPMPHKDASHPPQSEVPVRVRSIVVCVPNSNRRNSCPKENVVARIITTRSPGRIVIHLLQKF